ncbi:MAG TPA: amidohydrolase family protein [Capsulimonadaceae bacterium]|nr:amidohydrolase family protein [Capsulimonadaceae bacterium]
MPLFDMHSYLTFNPMSSSLQTQEEVVEAMKRYEIDALALISGMAATCDFVTGNRMLKDVLNSEFGIFGYVTLNAEFPEESLEEQRAYLHKRDIVGAVLFPRGHAPVNLDDAREIINGHRRYTKPLLIYTPDLEAVHAARKVAEEFNQMRVVLLTMGGEDWHAAVEAAKSCVNLYLEISGSLDAEKIAYAATALSSRKLVFGSGLPYADPSLFVGLVEEASVLTAGDRRRIYIDNALSLFQIQADVE